MEKDPCQSHLKTCNLGELGIEKCVCYEQVGTLAWDNPALAVTRAAQPMFPTETHDHLKRAWEWMAQPVRFLGSFKNKKKVKAAKKVVVFGGGSFATAMAVIAARAQPQAQVVMLLRDEAVRDDINYRQMNNRYLRVSPLLNIFLPTQHFELKHDDYLLS
jgi:NADPH-dependent glutamate synthase beta subunit-like oxidoreductase